MAWLLVLVRIPAEPSKHRVAVWREMRRIGAVPLAPGVWTAPVAPAFLDAVERAGDLASRGGGDLVILEVTARDERSAEALREIFASARRQEWAEFLDDCEKFEAEISKEVGRSKFTLAELEEEEQSVDRLRRWFRDLKARDVLGLPEALEAAERLKSCAHLLDKYADRVYQVVHGHLPAEMALPVGPQAEGSGNA